MREPVQVVAKGWAGPLGYAPKPTQPVTAHVAGPVPSTGQLALTLTAASGEQITVLLASAQAFEIAGALTRTQLPVPGESLVAVCARCGKDATGNLLGHFECVANVRAVA